MQEILNNEGAGAAHGRVRYYIDAAERALEDTMDAAIYSDGTANGGKAAHWARDGRADRQHQRHVRRHRSRQRHLADQDYDAQSMVAAIGTQVSATTIRPYLNYIMTKQSRGKQYADLLVMSPEHYAAYDAATIAIQRQTNETSLGKLGFSALEYIGGGKRAEIVLDGGIGSNMPANTTFGINTDSLRLRYHPNRNFDKLIEGDGMMPIDKDAIAQFIGWMGELTMTNPLFNWRFYDRIRRRDRWVARKIVASSHLPNLRCPTGAGRRSSPFPQRRRKTMAIQRDPDAAVVAIFKNQAIPNPAKTAKEEPADVR